MTSRLGQMLPRGSGAVRRCRPPFVGFRGGVDGQHPGAGADRPPQGRTARPVPQPASRTVSPGRRRAPPRPGRRPAVVGEANSQSAAGGEEGLGGGQVSGPHVSPGRRSRLGVAGLGLAGLGTRRPPTSPGPIGGLGMRVVAAGAGGDGPRRRRPVGRRCALGRGHEPPGQAPEDHPVEGQHGPPVEAAAHPPRVEAGVLAQPGARPRSASPATPARPGPVPASRPAGAATRAGDRSPPGRSRARRPGAARPDDGGPAACPPRRPACRPSPAGATAEG